MRRVSRRATEMPPSAAAPPSALSTAVMRHSMSVAKAATESTDWITATRQPSLRSMPSGGRSASATRKGWSSISRRSAMRGGRSDASVPSSASATSKGRRASAASAQRWPTSRAGPVRTMPSWPISSHSPGEASMPLAMVCTQPQLSCAATTPTIAPAALRTGAVSLRKWSVGDSASSIQATSSPCEAQAYWKTLLPMTRSSVAATTLPSASVTAIQIRSATSFRTASSERRRRCTSLCCTSSDSIVATTVTDCRRNCIAVSSSATTCSPAVSRRWLCCSSSVARMKLRSQALAASARQALSTMIHQPMAAAKLRRGSMR